MAKPLPEQVFPYLAIGLAKYTEQEQQYPYPPELLYAQHHLSLAMPTSYPATITGFFELCKKPLEEWWPSSTLPLDIDRRFELLNADGEISQQVLDYFEAYLPNETTLRDIQIILDNELMVKILNTAKQAALHDPVVANREYNAVRQYVITTPWTTDEKLGKHFQDLHHININDVGDLYHDSRSADSTLLYRSPDMPTSCYWNCDVCGPLYLRHNRLGSIKPSACEQRCPGIQGWQPLDASEHSLVLKRGIHLRTHLPGKAELHLYRELTNEIQPTQATLRHVVLWPGIDCYDLQLIFTNNEIWAVDVKDYIDPFALGKRIKSDNRNFKQSDLKWDKWFYVYPLYRERQRPDYQSCVHRIIGQLPSNVDILSEKKFKMLVKSR